MRVAASSGGMHRVDVEYAWPTVFRPSHDVTLVYLDLNQWIALAKAATGHKDGGCYLSALEAARSAKARGTAIFPLSGTHYMELAGIANYRQRCDIAEVMEELSGFTTILSRALLIRLEVDATLTVRFGPRPEPYAPLTLLNFGVGPAFGMVGGLRIRNLAGRDVTEEARLEDPRGPEAFDAALALANVKFEREMLRGPSPEEAERLRKAGGWDPLVARKIATERAESELEQVANLASSAESERWRQARLRDITSARHFVTDLSESTVHELNARAIRIEDAFPVPPGDPDQWTPDDLDAPTEARRFSDSMPSSDVCVTLMTEMHRNPQRKWTRNDIFDIDALSVAVAYCDAVLCDNDKAQILNLRKVGERLGTRISSRLADLPDIVG